MRASSHRPSNRRTSADAGPARRSTELAAAFAATEFVWLDGRGCTRIGAVLRAGAGQHGRHRNLPPSFHVLTAWNPDSRRLSDAVNRRRNARLVAGLTSEGRSLRSIRGRAPLAFGSDWFEESYVVEGLSRADAVRWGRAFGQVAVFEIEGDLRRVVGCETGRAARGHRLGWSSEKRADRGAGVAQPSTRGKIGNPSIQSTSEET